MKLWLSAALVLVFLVAGACGDAARQRQGGEETATPLPADPFRALGLKSFEELEDSEGIDVACEQAIGWIGAESDLQASYDYFIERGDADKASKFQLELRVAAIADSWLNRNGERC